MRFRLPRSAVLACLLLIGARLSAAEILTDLHSPAASEARLKKDVTYLASDELEGRGVSTRGINVAADFIAAEFKKAGLKPGGKDGTYFQPFTMPGAVLLKPATLKLRGPGGQEIELKSGEHFEPSGVSTSGTVSGAEVVFVGYGITSKDPEIDDYDGLDVAGKVVVILRDTPRADDKFGVNQNWRRKYASVTEKMTNAVAHKAAAILFVNDRDTAADGDDLLNFAYYAGYGGSLLRLPEIPALHVRRSVVEQILGAKLEDLERDIDRDLKPRVRRGRLDGEPVRSRSSAPRTPSSCKNVVGVLEGSGDAEGRDGRRRRPLRPPRLRRRQQPVQLEEDGDPPRRRRQRLGHDLVHGTGPALRRDAEARGPAAGLHGLQRRGERPARLEAYCKDPLFPLSTTAAMVNLDMVGRLVKDKASGRSSSRSTAPARPRPSTA